MLAGPTWQKAQPVNVLIVFELNTILSNNSTVIQEIILNIYIYIYIYIKILILPQNTHNMKV